jgi:hypothetical protein
MLLFATGVVGAVILWKAGSPTSARAVWVAGAAIIAVYYLLPAVQRPLYMTWMYAAFPVGWLVSHAILGAIFYGVLTPIGILVRLLSHDPLLRQFDASVDTYWIKHEVRDDLDRYFKQF